MDSVGIVTLVVVVVTILPAVVICWWYWDGMNVKVQSDVNDDDTAAKTFIDILEKAQKTLVIYDDGNKMCRTIYNDECVIRAVRNRLSSNQELVVRCLFNDADDLELVRTMRSEYPDRFKVWYRLGPRPLDDIHYKIADEGLMGHLSSHAHGQPERQFKLLDCSTAKPRTRRIAFGQYLNRFETDISCNAVAAT